MSDYQPGQALIYLSSSIHVHVADRFPVNLIGKKVCDFTVRVMRLYMRITSWYNVYGEDNKMEFKNPPHERGNRVDVTFHRFFFQNIRRKKN